MLVICVLASCAGFGHCLAMALILRAKQKCREPAFHMPIVADGGTFELLNNQNHGRLPLLLFPFLESSVSETMVAWQNGTMAHSQWPRGRLFFLTMVVLIFFSLIGTVYHSHQRIETFLTNSRYGYGHGSSTSPHPPKNKPERWLIKVGGVPQEGFGSTLQFMKDGMRFARVFDVKFAPVRTFDFPEFNYNVVDELNLGLDFSKLNWNNMCNLHTTITTLGGHEVFPERITRLRKNVDKLIQEARQISLGRPYDAAWIEEVRENVEHCDVILYADQEVHQDYEWDPFTQEWVKEAITRNADIKIAQGKAQTIEPRDVHVHYRWGDVVENIKNYHDNGKWNFDNEALEQSIKSVETCLGRKLSSNIFMKRSEKQESDDELRKIIAPIRQDARIVEGEDDIVDLLHLSQAKVLAITGGTYSSTAAALGKFSFALVITNGWHQTDYDHLVRDGITVLEQGISLSQEQCVKVRKAF